MRQCLNETEVVKPPRASLHKKQKIQTTIIYYVLDACDHCSYKNYPLYNVRMGSNPIPGIYTYICTKKAPGCPSGLRGWI